MQIVRIGLDLAKYVFEIHGVDAHGKTVVRKTLRRHAVSAFFANLPPCLIGMEASNGAHFWAKALSDLGHDVRLISPQFVTPYVRSLLLAAIGQHQHGPCLLDLSAPLSQRPARRGCATASCDDLGSL